METSKSKGFDTQFFPEKSLSGRLVQVCFQLLHDYYYSMVEIFFVFIPGGYDRHYKLWNLKTPYLPITTFKRGMTVALL